MTILLCVCNQDLTCACVLHSSSCQKSLQLHPSVKVYIISVAGGSPVRPQGSQVEQQRGGAPGTALPRPRQPQIGPR